MESDAFVDFILSPTYLNILRSAALICVAGAVALTIFVFAHYGRARETGRATEAPWTLIIGATRDSFLLTLLYTVEALLYRAMDSGSGLSPQPEAFIYSMTSQFGGIVLHALIAVIAVLRVIALTEWLRSVPRGPT
jgi:hypothetical protein